MATLNPARYFRLDHEVGAIAPGRLAHILVAPSLENPTPRLVFGKGRLAAEEGRLVIDDFQEPPAVKGSRPFAISRIAPELFQIAKRVDLARVPVITILDRTVTGAEEIAIAERNGVYEPPEDILRAFLISRDGHKTGRGFVKGFGRGVGGLASTVAHDTHGLLVLGSRTADMALAARNALETHCFLTRCITISAMPEIIQRPSQNSPFPLESLK